MIALALLASHLVGDFIFQTRWQSARKFGWTRDAIGFRTAHCLTYTLAFVPVYLAYDFRGSTWRAFPFLPALFLLHFLTDAQRFTSTLGDWLGWHLGGAKRDAWREHGRKLREVPQPPWHEPPSLPPNPWPTLPICIDQTLHVVQLAALGWLLI